MPTPPCQACDASRELVDDWAQLALRSPRLFTDDPSTISNEPSFYEHRHDQAIFAALMHKRGWHGSASESWRFAEATRLRTEALEFWGRQRFRE